MARKAVEQEEKTKHEREISSTVKAKPKKNCVFQ